MQITNEIDVRTLSQPTLARMTMLYCKALHEQTELTNTITKQVIETGQIEQQSFSRFTTSLSTIHECLSADVNMLLAQDKPGSK